MKYAVFVYIYGTNIKYQISNIKYQISNIKYKDSLQHLKTVHPTSVNQ